MPLCSLAPVTLSSVDILDGLSYTFQSSITYAGDEVQPLKLCKNMISLLANCSAVFLSKIFHKIRPIIVHLNVTNRCNLKCNFCYNQGNTAPEMTRQEYMKIIDCLAAAGTIKITLLGGEPFLREDLEFLIQYAKKHIRYVFLTTNGLFPLAENPQIVSVLDGLSFSINEAFTLGVWQKIAENIKYARRMNKTVSLSYILIHTNCQKLEEILTFTKTHNIGTYFTPAIHSTLPMQHKVQEEIQRIIKAKQDGYPVIDSFTYLRGLNKRNPKKNCYAGKLFFVVNTNGDLYPCLNFIGKSQFVMGNLLQSGFRFDTIRYAPPCNQCNWNCHEEANYLFSFHPEAVFNLIKSSYGRQALF